MRETTASVIFFGSTLFSPIQRDFVRDLLLRMDEILHHPENPGMMIPLKLPTNIGFQGFKVVQDSVHPQNFDSHVVVSLISLSVGLPDQPLVRLPTDSVLLQVCGTRKEKGVTNGLPSDPPPKV